MFLSHALQGQNRTDKTTSQCAAVCPANMMQHQCCIFTKVHSFAIFINITAIEACTKQIPAMFWTHRLCKNKTSWKDSGLPVVLQRLWYKTSFRKHRFLKALAKEACIWTNQWYSMRQAPPLVHGLEGGKKKAKKRRKSSLWKWKQCMLLKPVDIIVSFASICSSVYLRSILNI